MIRSLIAELVCQFPSYYIQPQPHISTQDIESGSTELLCKPFTSFIRQLPPRLPVIRVVDGIGHYEAEGYL